MMNISELEKKIKDASIAYYTGNPIMSNDEWDALVDDLRAIDPNNAILKTTGWGYSISGAKCKHKYQHMGSLNKARAYNEIDKSLLNTDIVLSAKMDGSSAVLYYVNGKLTVALTRGDGNEGRVITDKIKIMTGNPTIENFTGAIRGEVVISNGDWRVIQQIDNTLKSQRNAAAGVLGRDSVDVEILKHISFVAYDVLGCESDIAYWSDRQDVVLNRLSKFFKVVPHTCPMRIDQNTNLKDFFDAWSAEWIIDGVVLTDNRLTINNSVVTYNQQAYKFQSQRKYSKVVNIDWNLTKSNKLVPTIEIEPVELAGATITRCTAFNAQYIVENSIKIGSTVEIERSGEVIPKIIRVVHTPESSDDIVPDVCPICGSYLVWDGVNLVCDSTDCPNIAYRDLQQWVNVIGETDGIGDTLMFTYLDNANITCIDDLYNHDWIDTVVGGKQAQLFKIAMAKVLFDKVPLEKLLLALNIPRLGKTTCSKLASKTEMCIQMFNDAIHLGAISHDVNIALVNECGVATRDSIVNNVPRLKNAKYVLDRLEYPANVESQEKGKVAITGKLSMKRGDFEKVLNSAGYTVGEITKDTLYLITDNPNSGSSKNAKADKLGVKKITEAEMLAIINNN